MSSYDVARGDRSDAAYEAEVRKGKVNEKIAADYFKRQWRMLYPDKPVTIEPVPQPEWIKDGEGNWVYEPDFTITQKQKRYLEVKTCVIDDPQYLFFKQSQVQHMVEKFPGWILFAMPSKFAIITPEQVLRQFDKVQECPQLDNKITYYVKPGHFNWHEWTLRPPFVDKQGKPL